MKMNISQQILALDARYNAYRAPNNPQYRKYNSFEAAFNYRTVYLYVLYSPITGRIFIL